MTGAPDEGVPVVRMETIKVVLLQSDGLEVIPFPDRQLSEDPETISHGGEQLEVSRFDCQSRPRPNGRSERDELFDLVNHRDLNSAFQLSNQADLVDRFESDRAVEHLADLQGGRAIRGCHSGGGTLGQSLRCGLLSGLGMIPVEEQLGGMLSQYRGVSSVSKSLARRRQGTTVRSGPMPFSIWDAPAPELNAQQTGSSGPTASVLFHRCQSCLCPKYSSKHPPRPLHIQRLQ